MLLEINYVIKKISEIKINIIVIVNKNNEHTAEYLIFSTKKMNLKHNIRENIKCTGNAYDKRLHRIVTRNVCD